MVQLLLIKNKPTDLREIGDIIGIFDENHIFSDREKIAFDIMIIESYTQETLNEYLLNRRPKTAKIYKSKIADKWTFDRPEKDDAWQHTDSKWYFLKNIPKYRWTIKNMTQNERDVLKSKESTVFDKITALNHIESKYHMDSKNMIEITDLE